MEDPESRLLQAAAPERSATRVEEDIRYEQPVRSYLFAWLPSAVWLGVYIALDIFHPAWIDKVQWKSAFEPPFPLVPSLTGIGCLWMFYQAVRYELRPLRFVLLAFLPFSFIWYYYERYLRRQFRQRLPIVVRERLSARPSS